MKLGNMLDANGNIIANVKLQPLATAPTAANYVGGIVSGAMYYDTTTNTPRMYNGNAWVPLTLIAGTTGQVTVTYTGNPLSAVVAIDPAFVATYMPKSGGTFTGPITGTSATFTSITATNITGLISSATSAAQADKLKTAQNFSLNGSDVSAATVSFDGTGAVVLSANLKPTGVVPNTYGNATTIPIITVDDKGRITGMTTSALSITGANGGTVTSISASSTTLVIGGSPITTSGNIVVNLSASTTPQAGMTKISFDQYGRVSASGYLTSSDIPTLAGAYVPLSGGTMTGNLGTPSITVTGTGITINNDGQGVTFFGGAKIYKNNGGEIRIKRNSGDMDPMVENNAGTSAWKIWHAGNLSGSQTGHNHYTQFTSGVGISYDNAGTFSLTPTGTVGTYTKVVTDAYGRVVAGSNQTSADIPALPYIPVADKGAAGGVAIYDGTGHIYTSALPDVIVGQLHYGGVWNAATNTPTLLSASQVSGTYYIVQTSGNSIPAGGLSTQTLALVSALSAATGVWNVGDWVVSNGTTWDKVDNTDSISTWNGRTGSVVPSAGDYNAGQITSTAVGVVTGTTVQAALTAINTELGKKLMTSGGTMTGTLYAPAISATSVSAINLYDTNFSGSKVLVSLANKSISESTITTTELGYLSGTSANIQEQLNSKMTGSFTNGDDYCVPVFLSAGGFQNSSSYIVGATKEKFVMTDKTQPVTDDYHSPGLGIQIGYQSGTSGTNSTGFFFTMDTSGSTKLYNGKWYGSAWNNYWNITSAGVMQLPQMGGTSGMVAVTSAGNFIKYSLTSADLPNLSSIYMPISGGNFTGAITAPSATINSLTATGGITFHDQWNQDVYFGYTAQNGPLYIKVGGITYVQFDGTGIQFNQNTQFNSGTTSTFYSSATFYNPVKIQNTLEVTGNINASTSTISAFNIVATATSFFTGISATNITATNLYSSTLYENGQALSSRYLPLSGGAMNGNISFNGNSGIRFGGSGMTSASVLSASKTLLYDNWAGIAQFTAGAASGITGGIGAVDGLYLFGYNGVALGSTGNNNTVSAANQLISALVTRGTDVYINPTATSANAQAGVLRVDTGNRIIRDTSMLEHKVFTSASVTLTGGPQTVNLTHGLGRKEVTVKMYDNTDFAMVIPDINYNTSTTSTVVLNFSIPQPTTMYVIVES